MPLRKRKAKKDNFRRLSTVGPGNFDPSFNPSATRDIIGYPIVIIEKRILSIERSNPRMEIMMAISLFLILGLVVILVVQWMKAF